MNSDLLLLFASMQQVADLRTLRPAVAWLLFAAFAAHNVEEALTMPAFLRDAAQGPLGAFGVGEHLLPPFLVAVTAVTIFGLAITATHAIAPRLAWPHDALRILAWVMLVNVAVPHAPAAVMSGGYAPGLATALAVTLPVTIAYLVSTSRRRVGKTRTGVPHVAI